MAKRNSNASRGAPFTKTFKRVNMPGRTRGGRHAKRVDASFAGFSRRLRRLEFAVLHLIGEFDEFDLDKFKDAVLSLEADAKIEGRRDYDERGAIQVPLEGSRPGQGERADRAGSGSEGGGEDSPFPPSPPPQTEAE